MFARQRERVDFWLDLLKPDEWELLQVIGTLKKQRLFAKTVRDGIWLIWDLSQGKTDALLELFPWVADHFRGASGDGLSVEELREMIRLEASNSQPQSSDTVPVLVSGNLKVLSNSDDPPPAPEVHDDLADLLEVKDVSSESGGGAAQNLINSMLAMQSVKSDKPAKANKVAKKRHQSLEDLLEVKTVGSA